MAARNDPYQRLTRAELLAALRESHASEAQRESDHCRAVHDLLVHQEELAAQNEQLIEAQRTVELSRGQFQELFDFCPVPYVVLDVDGVVQRINVAAATMVGAERRRLEGVPLLVWIDPPDRRIFLDHMRRCRRSDDVVISELSLKSRRGGAIPVELVSRRSLTESDPVFHTTATDLRERRRLEHERDLAAAERHRLHADERAARSANEAKDRFLAILSHELRTPLTPVLLATSAWKDDSALPEQFRKALAMISRNVGAQARLIDDLLDMTRITQDKIVLQREPLELHAIVEEVYDQLRPEMTAAGVTGALALHAPNCQVSADPLRMKQIVWNLVKNAIRFTPAGGRITLATEDARPGAVRLVVTDTGAGFDAAIGARMFEPFHQGPRSAAHGGLGLGLAITKGLVEAHEGTIAASSDGPQCGARFVVELPVTSPEVPASEPLRAGGGGNGAAPHGRLRVLLVEDHEDTAQALAYVLEHEGYTVAVAHSVAQAIAAADAHEIDVVVTDLGLPDGSGLDLMRHLQGRRKPTQAIALTGYGRPEDLDETTRAGFQRHLTKPVDVPTLIAAIESLRPSAA